MKNKLIALALACLIILIVAVCNMHIYEDWSFRLFQFSGCLPGGICN